MMAQAPSWKVVRLIHSKASARNFVPLGTAKPTTVTLVPLARPLGKGAMLHSNPWAAGKMAAVCL